MSGINYDAISDAVAKKFFEEHIKNLPPQIPDKPYEREEILDPSKPLPFKRRLRMFMEQKELEKMEEYEKGPDVMTFNKFYPQPGRTQMMLKYAEDPDCKHLPLADRVQYGFNKMNHAYQVAHPEEVEATQKISREVQKSLFGSDEELMAEMNRLYHEDPKKVLPFIKGQLKGDDYWEKLYGIHVSLCAQKGIPPFKVPEEIPERESTVLFKKARTLIDSLGKLKNAAEFQTCKDNAKNDDEIDWEENDRIFRECCPELWDQQKHGHAAKKKQETKLPEVWEDWNKHFNVKTDPFTGGYVPITEGLKIVCKPYKSDFGEPNSKKKTPEYDWKAMREKLDRDFAEWEQMQKEKREKEMKEAEEKKKKEDDKKYEEAMDYIKKFNESRTDPKTGKTIGFTCFPDLD